jgi:hypothetical protein
LSGSARRNAPPSSRCRKNPCVRSCAASAPPAASQVRENRIPKRPEEFTQRISGHGYVAIRRGTDETPVRRRKRRASVRSCNHIRGAAGSTALPRTAVRQNCIKYTTANGIRCDQSGFADRVHCTCGAFHGASPFAVAQHTLPAHRDLHCHLRNLMVPVAMTGSRDG